MRLKDLIERLDKWEKLKLPAVRLTPEQAEMLRKHREQQRRNHERIYGKSDPVDHTKYGDMDIEIYQ